MGTSAEIDEVTLHVCGDRLPIGKPLDKLDLISLTARLEKVDCFLLGELSSINWEITSNNFSGTSFDLLQVFRSK